MVDIGLQSDHWKRGAQEEWQVAGELLEKGRLRHALFFTHLAVEKALKAHVCRKTGDLAPRTHNLVRLAEVAGLQPSPDQLRILAALNEFVLAGRYPESLTPEPSSEEARRYRSDAEKVFQWLMNES